MPQQRYVNRGTVSQYTGFCKLVVSLQMQNPKEIRKKTKNGLISLILQCANLCRTDVKQKCTALINNNNN